MFASSSEIPQHNTIASTKYWLQGFFDLFWFVFFLMVQKLKKRYVVAFWTALQGRVKTLDMRSPSNSTNLDLSSRQENLDKIFWNTKVNRPVEFHQPVESGHYFQSGNTVYLYSELFWFL